MNNVHKTPFIRLVSSGYGAGYVTYGPGKDSAVRLTPLFTEVFQTILDFIRDNQEVKDLTEEILKPLNANRSFIKEGLGYHPDYDDPDYNHMQCFIDEFIGRLVDETKKWSTLGEKLLQMIDDNLPMCSMLPIQSLAAIGMYIYYERFPLDDQTKTAELSAE